MKIKDAIQIMKIEAIIGRTPTGRSMTDYAVDSIEAALSDEKNYEMECLKCINCGIIQSGLLCAEGCPNCGSKDLTTDIN